MIQILKSEKSFFTQTDAPPVNVPKNKELSSSKVLAAVLPHSEIEKYLPDKRGKAYTVVEDFVLRIVNKLEPEFFTKTIVDSQSLRNTVKTFADKTGTIKMQKSVYDLLMTKPLVSRKCLY